MRRYDDRIRPSAITPPEIFFNRRQFLITSGAVALAGTSLSEAAAEQIIKRLDAPLNPKHDLKLKLTDRKIVTSYNNFYEFGSSKSSPSTHAEKLRTRPWTVEVTGEVEKPKVFGIEDILKMPLQERIYRFRCVEAWSMVVPWIGIEFNEIAKIVAPTSRAKYVRFTSVMQPEAMPDLKRKLLDWPYTEGLRIDEAMHPLTLLTIGLYGETLPNQNGAPVRMVVPWKYGFKGAKSIVRIEFVEEQPITTWMKLGPDEYGFYSNVNPDVSHPRWSQERERVPPSLFATQDTLKFNGYADDVAALYMGMDLQKNF